MKLVLLKKLNRVLSFLLSVCIVCMFGIIPVHAADVNDVYNLINNTTNPYLNTIKNSNAQIESYSSNISTKVTSIQSLMNTYLPNLLTISNHIQGIENTINYISDVGFESGGYVFTSISNTASNTTAIRSDTGSILSGLNLTLPDIHDSVVQLQEVLASDEDLAIRQGQQSRVQAIEDDFLDSSGDASVSLGDLGTAKDSVSELKGALSGGASSSQLWDILSSSFSGWGWYSQATADDLDTTNRTRSHESYEYLDNYYRYVFSQLGGDYND